MAGFFSLRGFPREGGRGILIIGGERGQSRARSIVIRPGRKRKKRVEGAAGGESSDQDQVFPSFLRGGWGS